MTCYDSASVDVYRRSDTFTVPSVIPNPPTPVNSDVSDSLCTNSEIPYSHGDRFIILFLPTPTHFHS